LWWNLCCLEKGEGWRLRWRQWRQTRHEENITYWFACFELASNLFSRRFELALNLFPRRFELALNLFPRRFEIALNLFPRRFELALNLFPRRYEHALSLFPRRFELALSLFPRRFELALNLFHISSSCCCYGGFTIFSWTTAESSMFPIAFWWLWDVNRMAARCQSTQGLPSTDHSTLPNLPRTHLSSIIRLISLFSKTFIKNLILITCVTFTS
jgi:hypothetical protein